MADYFIKTKFSKIEKLNKFEESVLIEMQEVMGFMLDGYIEFISLCKSPIERILAVALYNFYTTGYIAHHLKKSKLSIIPQYKITTKKSYYIADFYIEYEKDNVITKLVVECDGHEFHQSTKEQVTKDKLRDRELLKLGYKIVHFTGSEIFKDNNKCIFEIINLLGITIAKEGE